MESLILHHSHKVKFSSTGDAYIVELTDLQFTVIYIDKHLGIDIGRVKLSSSDVVITLDAVYYSAENRIHLLVIELKD